ncbi:hypothetical protein CC80DRAFT_47735 [Byssothecium circinans]|uniref:Uncharacterized protein n=1 Tax=Byssothecium circinans TaxID=147558 RepID=A0A6A5TZ19_9PLEO|nr:hypothetical protein CC80DRAFT_47735 [Byssothecium circinans]
MLFYSATVLRRKRRKRSFIYLVLALLLCLLYRSARLSRLVSSPSRLFSLAQSQGQVQGRQESLQTDCHRSAAQRSTAQDAHPKTCGP